MKIEWFGHSAFLITSREGKRIITDPYRAGSYGGDVGYKPINTEADIVTVSHDHDDHNDTSTILGSPEIVRGTGKKEAKEIEFTGIPSYHDTSKGRERGPNTIYTFELDGLKICHLGDLGEALSEEQIGEIGEVDILFIPVGGFYTIDARVASSIVETLKPRVVIPMHYKTEVLGFPVAEVDEFLEGKEIAKRIGKSEIEITRENLPSQTEIWVLEHSK